MKRQISSLFLVGVCSASLLPVVVMADSSASDVTANVEAGTGAGEPEELIMTKPGHTNGEFVIKAVSDFTFPSVPIGETRSGTIEKDKAYGIEVVDVTGSGTGWHVKVTLPSLTVADGANKGEELKGWELTIPSAEITSKNSSLAAEEAPVGKVVNLSANVSAVIFAAEADKGMGRYTNIFERYRAGQTPTRTTGVQLSIPNSARKAAYSGKLEWTLLNVPKS